MLFDSADFNGDGKLSGDEFFAFSHPEGMLTFLIKLSSKTSIWGPFEGLHFLIDWKGKVSIPVWYTDNLEKMKGALLKNSKEQRDKNKDGKIDFQEFIGSRGQEHDKEWIEEEKNRWD